jgi:hypothetical protein
MREKARLLNRLPRAACPLAAARLFDLVHEAVADAFRLDLPRANATAACDGRPDVGGASFAKPSVLTGRLW